MVNSLLNGFQNFKKKFFSNESDFFAKLVKNGQAPKTMIISCSDSRVDPAILFNTKPGDLFVVRNVANLVPPFEEDDVYHGVSSALEYAVKTLKVQDIIILGHSHCGGISALCSFCKKEAEKQNSKVKNETKFIENWVKISKDALIDLDFSKWPGETQHIAEKNSIKNSLKNLKSFPWISKSLVENKLEIHGWWFDMEKANLWCFNEKNNSFEKF